MLFPFCSYFCVNHPSVGDRFSHSFFPKKRKNFICLLCLLRKVCYVFQCVGDFFYVFPLLRFRASSKANATDVLILLLEECVLVCWSWTLILSLLIKNLIWNFVGTSKIPFDKWMHLNSSFGELYIFINGASSPLNSWWRLARGQYSLKYAVKRISFESAH